MNNEHYCLAYEDSQGKLKIAETYPPPKGSIKLYTHPAKTLTDEEAKHHYNKGHEDGRKLATVKTLTDEEIFKWVEKYQK